MNKLFTSRVGIVLLCALIAFGCYRQGNRAIVTNRSVAAKGNDSLLITENLPVLLARPCLNKLLQAIVISDSTFKPTSLFYNLYFSNRKKYWTMSIVPNYWHDAEDTSYIAIIKIKDAEFLCSGDIKGNPFFYTKVPETAKIELTFAKKSTHIGFPEEPSLQGTFSACEGLPVYTEVYIHKPVIGYTMHFQNQSLQQKAKAVGYKNTFR